MLPQNLIICVCVSLLQAPTQHHHSHSHLPPAHSGTLWQKQSTWGIAEGNCIFPQPFPIHSTLEQLLRKISSLDPWTHFRSPVACGKHFHSHSWASPLCPWMLPSTSCPATARVQPGELIQLTAWWEKQKACPAFLPLGGSMLLDWQEPSIHPPSLEAK